ncbi:tyrosine-type recombinase/integrase [Photobacterium lutimaris]|uniref:Site-specific integrase n=1 Tax=Photobacterium lutimaris TaxID=388278 RepID=A0A2T3ITG3_9GAMM|nr:site-specific integrase [Photobacterium lutimaris]PSU31655.1 site-specific integrase [Photobacterium lutimaris]TDR72711.1 site-specific recombinase XerD [Photobacterium lutimaris]
MMPTTFSPLFPPLNQINEPITDIRQFVLTCDKALGSAGDVIDTYELAAEYLHEQSGNKNNYAAYRRDMCIFLNWLWLVRKGSVRQLGRLDMKSFIEFANNPPAGLIARNTFAILIEDPAAGWRVNTEWRPFVNRNHPEPYQRKESSLRAQLSVISGFYTFMAEEDYCEKNPAAIALRRYGVNNVSNLGAVDADKEKALSHTQQRVLLETVDRLATLDPDTYERTRFLIHLGIFCYPRISEIASTNSRSPAMSQFKRRRGPKGVWNYSFYIEKSKGGKSRHVTCSDNVINALARYRRYLGLSEFPHPDETHPLFVRHKAGTHGREFGVRDANLGTHQISELVSKVFEETAQSLDSLEEFEEAREIRQLTFHTLRHTGISNDLEAKRNPNDVMADSGHSNLSTLAIYTSRRLESRQPSANLKDEYINSILYK